MNNENQLMVEDKDTDKDKGKKRDKKDIVKNIAIVFLCIMLALTFFSNTIMNYSLAQVATTTVDSGEIIKEIPISGEIVAEDPYEVTVKESRKISGVAVKEGAHVKKDDILFYLDDIESEEFLAEKEKLDELELKYDTELFSGNVPDDVITNVRKGKKSSHDKYQSELKAATDRYDAALDADRAAQAQIDAITQKATTDKADSDYNAATPGYTLAQLDADLSQAQADLAQVESDLEKAKANDEDTDELKEKVHAKRDRVENLQNKKDELTKDQSQLNNLGTQLDADNQKKLAAATAEKARTQAELEAATKEKEKVLASLGSEIGLTDLKDKIAESKAKLAKLEAESTGATIKAPVDGIISSINKVAGEKTNAEEPVAVIQVDGKDMTLECSVKTEQAKRVKVGNVATLTNPYSFEKPDSFKAILKSIRNDKKDPANMKVLTFKIESPEVTPGQEISLKMGEKPKHYDMIVPNNAVKGGDNKSYVLVLTEKSSPLGNRYIATKVDVKTLDSDSKNTAIEGNLPEYCSIITTASKAIDPGDQVRLAEK